MVSDGLTGMLSYAVIMGLFLVVPALLILANLVSAFRTIKSEKWQSSSDPVIRRTRSIF